MARQFGTIGVIGLGTMGSGIAEVFARNGVQVVAVEGDAAGLDRGRGHLERSTTRAVQRGKLSAAAAAELLGRIRLTTSLDDLAGCDLVIEAVPERLDVKRAVFGSLDAVVRPDAVLATNTSSLSVTEIAVASRNPVRVVGMHFFNPAPVLRLVEVVRTVLSDGEVVEDVTALARRLGKDPVVVGDRAGFIVDALLVPYLNDAVRMLEAGYAGADAIDTAMTAGCGYPMGPFQLLDAVGLDVALAIQRRLHQQSPEPGLCPAPLLEQMVTAGFLGRKAGRGFRTDPES